MPVYKFKIEGIGRAAKPFPVEHQHVSWEVTGEVEIMRASDFTLVPRLAMEKAFDQLTQGQAVYGKPGVGCGGPYQINKMLIERENA